MGALVDYWYYTGDPKWNEVAEEGLLFQAGPNNDYMPPNQTMTEGNDDQGFWGMAAMSAAECRFQNPPHDKPQWLALAQAVFNTQAARWETQECGGGLRWQIFTWNNGYDYKNSISQACFFNIAARLARYTGNQSYADWADKTWDWMTTIELINLDTYYVYDGAHTANCSEMTPYQWTYNAGAFLLGAAAMFNYSTGVTQARWRERLDGLLNGTMIFFTGDDKNIMTEVACEPVDRCNLDQQSFKAYLARWMAATTQLAPWTHDRIRPLLAASAISATSSCKGGSNSRMCGLRWNETGKWDGSQGVGQQMAAMELVLANMVGVAEAPVTNKTGGISVGDPGAGGTDVGRTDPFSVVHGGQPVTKASSAGAYICTVVAILGLLAGCVFVLTEEGTEKRMTASELFAALTQCGGWRRSASSEDNASGRSRPGGPILMKDMDGVIVIETHESLPQSVGERYRPSAGRAMGDAVAMKPRTTRPDTSAYWSPASPSSAGELPCRKERDEGLPHSRAMLPRAARRKETKQFV